MKVLISGAGPAGLTLAYWLQQYGFQPIIIERAPALLTGGYKIDVRGSALQVLHKMNVYDSVLAQSTNIQRGILIDKNGKVLNEMPGDTFGGRSGDDVEIIRGLLCEILADRISDVEIRFGNYIKGISQSSNEVEVLFQNDVSEKFDLVIGADGVHSNVRRLAFGEENKFLHLLGLYLCVFTVPNYLNLDRIEMMYSELGKVALVWSVHGEPNMKACFGFSAPNIVADLRNRTEQEKLLRSIYSDINWEVPRLLDLMEDAKDFYFDASAQIYMDRWSQNRVVLVGDAGYCPSPMSGQGTSLALIGAYVLAGELAAARGNLSIAFDQYEKQLRPFVQSNQQLGITSANLMRSREKKSLSNWLLNQLMRIAPGRLVRFFINLSTQRINRASNSIDLKDYSQFKSQSDSFEVIPPQMQLH